MLTFYDSLRLADCSYLPGVERLQAYFKVYGRGIAPVDRSEVLKLPVRMKSLFPLPKMRAFNRTYEQVCNERARELLARAGKLDTDLYAFWSGGIDSTCLLVSLLKMASSAQRERIVVLMSEASIAENPVFYRMHIRGQLRRESAMLFPYILGTNNLIVNGEHNDQLFGSDIIADVINRFGADAVLAPYDFRLLLVFLTNAMGGDSDTAAFYVSLFERLKEGAPIEIESNYDLFWWINFVMKWQTVYMRMLSYSARPLSLDYVKTYYEPFYNTEAFQLWSMNNPRQRLKNGWRSYKWPAKEVIFDFTKDADYRDRKSKRGSLKFLTLNHTSASFVDDKFAFHSELPSEQFYEPANDLV